MCNNVFLPSLETVLVLTFPSSEHHHSSLFNFCYITPQHPFTLHPLLEHTALYLSLRWGRGHSTGFPGNHGVWLKRHPRSLAGPQCQPWIYFPPISEAATSFKWWGLFIHNNNKPNQRLVKSGPALRRGYGPCNEAECGVRYQQWNGAPLLARLSLLSDQ